MAMIEDDFLPVEAEDAEGAPDAMGDEEIAGILRTEIEDAINFDETEYEQDRTAALEYYQGVMRDTPQEDGRSGVVSRDVADTIGEVMPSLMRVFFAGDQLVEYEPGGPEDEESADQATDYINYKLIKHCNIYDTLWDVFHDALLLRNGVISWCWDATPLYTTHSMTRLTDMQLQQVLQDGAELIEATETLDVFTLPDGQQQQIPVYDVKVRRIKERGRLKVEAVPPEEFLINKEAKSLEDARFVARRSLETRSDLRLRGYDEEMIESLPTHGDLENSETMQARFGKNSSFSDTVGLDESQQEVMIFDCYVRIDVDGDGISEWRHVVMGGSAGSEHIFVNEEWTDTPPFCDLTPERVPHRWQGRSIYDEVRDIQQIKTVIMRHTLDSCYISNNPDEFVQANQLVDPDEMLTREIGRRVRVKGDPNAVVSIHQMPFIGNHTFPMLDYMDGVASKRTGITQQSAALDAEVLQNQSATAANIAQSAQYSKIELIARNFAEQLRPFFRAVLRLVVENADRAEIIRLRGKFVEMDPRSWNADMDATVNIGLGSGSRERDLMMLQAVAQEQDKYLDNLGPNNPVVTLKQRRDVSAKIAEAGGLKNSQMFFAELTPDVMQQYQQQQAQQANQPPPEEVAKIQAEQAKAQMQQQADMAKLDAEMQLKRYQIDAEMQLKREQLAAELELKREMAALDREVRLQTGAMQANASSSVRMGGEPG
jgi:hypothetical protein